MQQPPRLQKFKSDNPQPTNWLSSRADPSAEDLHAVPLAQPVRQIKARKVSNQAAWTSDFGDRVAKEVQQTETQNTFSTQATTGPPSTKQENHKLLLKVESNPHFDEAVPVQLTKFNSAQIVQQHKPVC